jgi:DNA-binding LacI/PurR family transcriptional regulator
MQDNRPGSLPISEALYYHADPSVYAADCEKIGVIIPTAINPAYPDMADKLKRAAQAAGLCALVCNAQNSLRREADCLSVLLDANVSGIVAIPVCDDSHELYIEANPPVILYGCRTPEESLGYIAMDDILAGRIAAEHLTAQGHRRLAFLSYPARSYAVADRLNGFSTVVQEKSAELLIVNVSGGRLEDSYSAMLTIIESESPPTAIAASDDFIAIGAWHGAA